MPSFENYVVLAAKERGKLQFCFFLLSLISLLLNFKYDILLHQIGRNPILYQEIDPVYWLFMIAGIPNLAEGPFALIIDVLLFACCISGMIWRTKTFACWIFLITHFIYFILYNMMAGHHYVNVGILFLSVPFVFLNSRYMALAFLFCRFIFCYIMLSAGLWKVVRGGFFQYDQFHMLMLYHNSNALFDPGSFKAIFVQLFLKNGALSHAIWVALIVLELSFISGFITLKKDMLLLALYALFFVGGWLLLNIYNFENLVFLLTLYPVIQYNSIAYKKIFHSS